VPSFYFSLHVGGFKLPFVTVGAIMMLLVLVLFLQQLSVASMLGMIPTYISSRDFFCELSDRYISLMVPSGHLFWIVFTMCVSESVAVHWSYPSLH